MRIDRADSEAELLGPPISNREIVKVVAGDFEVRIAKTAEEIDAAQRLRYRIFYEEMSAHPTPEMAAQRRDFDPFDDICDHLLVLDRSCIAKDARNTATMQMLWRGIALYAYHYNIQLMFGCASMSGADPAQHAQAL